MRTTCDQRGHSGSDSHGRVSGTMLICASVVAMTVGGPLVGMMGLSLLASATLLAVSLPLLLLFSPLLLGAAFVLVAAMAGFSVAVAMAVAGVSAIGWVAKEMRVRSGGSGSDPTRMVTGKGREIGRTSDRYITTTV